jgi:hypothetical protein
MFRLLVLTLALAVAAPATAQDRAQTLADIRQELSVLWVEIQGLSANCRPRAGPRPISRARASPTA